LEEIQALDSQIDQARDLAALKRIFQRLNEIASQYADDFDVQLAAGEARERLIERGNRLKKTQPATPAARRGARQRPLKLLGGWNRAVWIGSVCGAAAALIVIAVLVGRARHSGAPPAPVAVAPAPPPPPSQILRIFTDLDKGTVALDDQPPVDLVEGQFILDPVAPGNHTVKVAGRDRESVFSFQVASGQPPSIAGPLTARNLSAVVVSSFANQARVVTNAGPMKLVVNGQREEDAGPAGVDLKNFQAGVDEIAVGEGRDLRGMKESFGPAPMITAFLKTDLNIGTLIVSTGEDDVQVFLNNKPYPGKTQRGQLRIRTIGSVNVRVAKDGFDPAPALTALVKKGEETRLEFKLNRTPVTAVLQVTGGTPGAEVWIDQRSAGAIGADGSFLTSAVAPGNHTVELRRERYVPKHYEHVFRAGQTFTISGADAVLATLPPPALPPKKEAAVIKEIPPAPPKAGSIADFEDPLQWKEDNGAYVHSGAAFLSYAMPPKGQFTFTVQLLKGGKARWRLMYLDSRNYAQFEIDNKNFVAKVITDGKSVDRTKTPLRNLDKQKEFTIMIDVAPEHIVHKLRSGDAWTPLDAWSEPGVRYAVGKFGFLVQGNDQIGLADFKFQPK
jgi:hypothetical protein